MTDPTHTDRSIKAAIDLTGVSTKALIRELQDRNVMHKLVVGWASPEAAEDAKITLMNKLVEKGFAKVSSPIKPRPETADVRALSINAITCDWNPITLEEING